MKVIGIIPARYASSRFPGKPLVDIKGKPMIQRVYEQAIASELEEVYVATDDERIEKVVESFGGKVVLTSKDIRNGSERCIVAFKKVGKDADAFINVQGDEPLIDPKSINELVDLIKQDGVDIATLIRTEEDEDEIVDPNRVKVVVDKKGRALLFSRSVIPFPRKKTLHLKRYIHLGIYAFKSSILDTLSSFNISPEEESEQLEQLTWLINGLDIYTAISESPSISIDTKEDLAYLESNWDVLKG